MDNHGIVSVIVPIYNVEKFLPRCIQSIQEQTYPFLEIVLVDDGSPDCCGELCEQYAATDQRIRVIHKANAGLGMARNSGLDISTGEYVVFIDSDDYVKNNFIEELLKAMLKWNADLATVSFVSESNEKKTKIMQTSAYKMCSGDEVIREQFLPLIGTMPEEKSDIGREMSVCVNMYRREIIEKLKLRFVSERDYVSEDLFFNMYYLLNSERVVCIPQSLYYYSVNCQSLTHTFREDRYEKYCRMYEKQKEILQAVDLFDIAKLRLYRTFIMKTKKCISMIAKSDVKWKDKILLCKSILNHKLLVQVICEYGKHVKGLKNKMQIFLLSRKMGIALLGFYYFK